VPVREVIRFAASQGLVHAHMREGSPVTDYTLTELEGRLGGAFVRTSRADLVNVEHVSRILSSGDGAATLTLSDGSTVHVSRRRASDVRRMLES
jgi:DNA-binding LytR/AlgR family response regulator